jgi:TfoX/Sxy family transcriptional regulator of competence genes
VNGTILQAKAGREDDFDKTILTNRHMAYDEHLAERISGVLKEKKVRFEAKNMMGGLCYMIKDKMAVGIIKDSLMIRIDPDLYESSLKKKGVRPMDFTGKVLKGFLLVDPIAIDMQKHLEHWIQLCLDFNPKAKSSKKSDRTKKSPVLPKKKKK